MFTVIALYSFGEKTVASNEDFQAAARDALERNRRAQSYAVLDKATGTRYSIEELEKLLETPPYRT